MHGDTLPSSIAAAALSACAIEPELLNSERIEQRFGSCGIEVLSDQPGLRRSALFSGDDIDRTCRTYAVVRFVDAPDAQVDSEHEQVLAGDSIGAIFKAGGWTIRKETLYIGATDLPRGRGSELATVMRLEKPCEIAIHIYRLRLHKDADAVDYATISEFHHPDYLDLAELRRLYPVASHKLLPSRKIEDLLNLSLDAA
jgi:hypothetical protein